MATSIKDKIPSETDIKLIVDNPKDIKLELNKMKDTTSEIFSSFKSSFQKVQSRFTKKKSTLSNDQLIICVLFFSSWLKNQIQIQDLYKNQFVIDFSILICTSIDTNFITNNTDLFQEFIIQMHTSKILNKRIKEIGKSPYSIVEPMIIQNWSKGVFTDSFRYIYRNSIYYE